MLVSGVVALTLSPMMASKLLRAGDTHQGFAGWINNRFDAIRRHYTRLLAATLRWRPATLMFAGLFALLMVPFYMFSMQELAPKEDQGVVFGIVQAAPNATIDPNQPVITDKVNEVFKSMPETGETFQITDPTFGFSGMVTKPWSERTRTTEEIVGEVFGKGKHHPWRARHRDDAGAVARREPVPD